MPIISELQRDRVALLLTLNVLLFVGYAVTVVTAIAVPNIWLVTVLIVGLAYNVIELWLSSPYKQPPDVVGMRARTLTKPATAGTAPRLGRAHRTEPVLGAQGITSGRVSLSQRLAELQSSMSLQTAGDIEPTGQSVEASRVMGTTEADEAVLSELPEELRENAGSESSKNIAERYGNIAVPPETENAGMIMTSVVAANDALGSDLPDSRSLLLHAKDEAPLDAVEQASSIAPEIVAATGAAAMVVDAGIPGLAATAMTAVESEVSTLNTVQITEPVHELTAEQVPSGEPVLSQVDDSVTTRSPVIAAVSEDRFESATASSVEVEVEPAPAVASVAIPAVIHWAGRRRDVVDIVIASMASDTKSPQPAKQPVADEQPALAAKVRTPSESLAMLRQELARTRGTAGTADHAKAPAVPRKPLGAARKPAKSPADGTRDRVMFVWHGRHFLAPIEGRHPLRVAQSLYDFMVEEAMEHG
jgi:hypothetical protein